MESEQILTSVDRVDALACVYCIDRADSLHSYIVLTEWMLHTLAQRIFILTEWIRYTRIVRVDRVDVLNSHSVLTEWMR